MRASAAFLCLAILAGSAGTAPAGSNPFTRDDLAVPLRLSTGTVLMLRQVDLVGEDLGRRLVLRAEMDGPRPPSNDPAQAALEGREAKEVCQTYMGEIVRLLPELPSRRITHLEVLYRHTTTHFRVAIHELRGQRLDTRKHACPGA